MMIPLYIYRHLQSVTRDLVLVTNVNLLDILSLAIMYTDSLHTGSHPDVGVTEQETNLLEGLVLGLGEEEVRDDSVRDVGDDKDHEVFPSKNFKTDRRDLADDDVVEPIGSGRSSGTHSSQVHGENLGLVDPRNGTKGPTESPGETEERGDTGDSSPEVRVARSTELFTDCGLPSQTDGHKDRTDNKRLPSTELVDDESLKCQRLRAFEHIAGLQ